MATILVLWTNATGEFDLMLQGGGTLRVRTSGGGSQFLGVLTDGDWTILDGTGKPIAVTTDAGANNLWVDNASANYQIVTLTGEALWVFPRAPS